jgi:lactoylglutathione lyase
MAISVNNYLGAVGIGVSNLERSAEFYMRIFGMKKVWKLKLPHMYEVVLNFEEGRGSSVVLMHYIDGSNPNYTNNPVKLVFYVTDPKACVEMISREGLEIVRDATPVPELRNAVVGLAKDPDGYLLEILQAQAPA